MTAAPNTMASSASRGSAAAKAGSGAYLTDGDRLFRVVTPLSWPPSEMSAELEDCMTLAVERYSAEELWGMGLRLVAPRRGSPAAEPRYTAMHDRVEEPR